MTAKNYEQFALLHERYAAQGLVILAFPCNQFGRQEPKSNAEIKLFAEEHGAKYPLFDKIDVNGSNAHPIYRFLRARLTGTLSSAIKWNFTKFVCNRKGVPLYRFGPYTTPLEMEDTIKQLLAEEADAAAADRASVKSVAAAAAADDDADDDALDALESAGSDDA